MPSKSALGAAGEVEVIEKVSCPVCGGRLELFPVGTPILDVYCSLCDFVAQVKTSEKKPTNAIWGATWLTLERYLQSGKMIPPHIVNWRWKKNGELHQHIVLIQNMTMGNIHQHLLRKRNLPMFWYKNLLQLETQILYTNPVSLTSKELRHCHYCAVGLSPEK